MVEHLIEKKICFLNNSILSSKNGALNLPFDAIHRYDPISLRESFDNFKTSPLKDETIIREKKKKKTMNKK